MVNRKKGRPVDRKIDRMVNRKKGRPVAKQIDKCVWPTVRQCDAQERAKCNVKTHLSIYLYVRLTLSSVSAPGHTRPPGGGCCFVSPRDANSSSFEDVAVHLNAQTSHDMKDPFYIRDRQLKLKKNS